MIKVAFAFENPGIGYVEIFGKCSEITLAAGLVPNVTELSVPKAEFAKFAGDCDRHGSIRLYGSDAAGCDAELYGWSVMFVRDGLIAKTPGGVYEVQEKIVVLSDRRWEFTGGRGGHYNHAPMNAPDAAGNIPTAQLQLTSAYQMCHNLATRMQYVTNINRVTIPEEAPLTTSTPLDVKWDHVHCPTELVRMLDEYGYVFLLQASGMYVVQKKGEGTLPAAIWDPFHPAQAAVELPSDVVYHRAADPAIVIVTSGRQRSFQEVTITGIAQSVPTEGNEEHDPSQSWVGWEYVSFDTDGSLQEVHQLSWLGLLATPEGTFLNHLRPANPDAWSGYDALYTIIRLFGPGRAKLLPMLNRSCSAIADGDSTLRAKPMRILARQAQWDGVGWHRVEDLSEVHNFRVDPFNGLIWFESPVGNISVSNYAQPVRYDDYWHIMGLDTDEPQITFAHECKDTGDYRDCFNAAYTLDANDNVVGCELEDAMDPNAKDVRVIECPHLLELRDADGLVQNVDTLLAEAERIAAGILKPAVQSRVHKFAGFLQLSPTGKYSAVHWDIEHCVTSVEEALFDAPGATFMKKEEFKKFLERIRGIPEKHQAAQIQTQNGGRDYSPMSAIPPGANSPREQHGVVQVGGTIILDNPSDLTSQFWDSTGLGKERWKGWALCNGNNGTQDMRGCYLYGGGPQTSGLDPDAPDVWGSPYDESYTDPGHAHAIGELTFAQGVNSALLNGTGASMTNMSTNTASGTISISKIKPKRFAVAFAKRIA